MELCGVSVTEMVTLLEWPRGGAQAREEKVGVFPTRQSALGRIYSAPSG